MLRHWGLSSANHSPSGKLRRSSLPPKGTKKLCKERSLNSSVEEYSSPAAVTHPVSNSNHILDESTVLVCSSHAGIDDDFNRERLGGKKQIKHWEMD